LIQTQVRAPASPGPWERTEALGALIAEETGAPLNLAEGLGGYVVKQP
jgi:hypothetical protein